MIFDTPTQFAVLALCLVAGWLFGLASAGGGRKWRDKLREVEAEHIAYRKDTDAKIAELTRERDRLAKAAPVTANMVTGEPVPADRQP